jgi:tripartite-type tricarboxylate transporter receptor subunit TctC
MMAGVDMVHVPYRGAALVLSDLLGGQVQVSFVATLASIAYIRAGKLRPLAVTTATRSEALPDIPTVGEFVPGYEASGWSGIGSPKNTPTEVIDKLNREINTALADLKIKDQCPLWVKSRHPAKVRPISRLLPKADIGDSRRRIKHSPCEERWSSPL